MIVQTRTEMLALIESNPRAALLAIAAAAQADTESEEFDEDESFDSQIIEALENCDFSVCGVEIKLVHEEGGTEGGGEYMEGVFAFMVCDTPVKFIRVTGTYSSWDDNSWDDEVTEVYPREVTRTEYFDTP